MEMGCSKRLAHHILGLFKRSPIPAFENELNFEKLMNNSCCATDSSSSGTEDDPKEEKKEDQEWWTKIPLSNEVAHFENLQSTNWNTLRFKSPPSIDSDIGWRVEFRPLDIQLTDFENAALTVFTGLMINVINEFALDFILPISLIDEGMLTCQEMDALTQKQFWWRVDMFDDPTRDYTSNTLAETNFTRSVPSTGPKDNKPKIIKKLYIWQILEGDASVHPTYTKGLIHLANEYMAKQKWTDSQIQRSNTYLSFLAKRSRGQIPTGARWQRDFVTSHKDYKRDSVVSGSICYDLACLIDALEDEANPRYAEVRQSLLGAVQL